MEDTGTTIESIGAFDDWGSSLPATTPLDTAPEAERSRFANIAVYSKKSNADFRDKLKASGITPTEGQPYVVTPDAAYAIQRLFLIRSVSYWGRHDFDDHGKLLRASEEKQDGLAESRLFMALAFVQGSEKPIVVVSRMLKSQIRWIGRLLEAQKRAEYSEAAVRYARLHGDRPGQAFASLPPCLRVGAILTSRAERTKTPDRDGKLHDYYIVDARCSPISIEEMAKVAAWDADGGRELRQDAEAELKKRFDEVLEKLTENKAAQ